MTTTEQTSLPSHAEGLDSRQPLARRAATAPGRVVGRALAPWMLVLLPGNAVVVLDLLHGDVRFDVWVARFVPAMLVLAFVAWAELSRSAAATRMRVQLRLAMPGGVALMLLSGVALCHDEYANAGFLPDLVRAVASFSTLIVAPAAVVLPWVVELRTRTWGQLLAQPGGRRALLEKFALGAGLVVISWLSAIAGTPRDFAEGVLLGHVLAIAAALPLFLLVENGFLAVVLTLLLATLGFLAADFSTDWPVVSLAVRAVLAVSSLALLAVLPRRLRRLPLVEAELGSAPGAQRWWKPSLLWRAELEPQLMLLALPALGALATIAFTLDGRDGAALPLFVCCATAALMSPGIVFSEARRLGTLEPLLAVLPRAVVFRRKLAAAGLFTFITCGVLPLITLFTTGTHQGGGAARLINESAGWLIMMGFLFAVGVVVAHFSSHAGLTLSLGAGAAVLLAGAQVALTEGSVVLLREEFLRGDLLAASFVGTSLVLLAMAWLNFSGQAKSTRVLSIGTATCLVQALALAVVGSYLPL